MRMTTFLGNDGDDVGAEQPATMSRADRRSLDALFRHPISHNLAWSDVVGLFSRLGNVEQKANHEFVFQVGVETHVMRKPHSKDLTASEIMDLRHFAARAGCLPNAPSEAPAHLLAESPALLVVVDHHGAKIYHIDVAGDDVSRHVIRPYDPHHFLHHLAHKDQSRERGQRAPEEASFYEEISQALAAGGKIVVVGHGEGKSNAAHHLAEYLAAHHPETYQRIVREVVADLSGVTSSQLLVLAAGA
jgi:hypothetical protein